MSSEIIYHQEVTRLPANANVHAEDLYFHLVQMGSSNCYECDHRRPGGNGRRSRSWNLISMGTRAQVLNTAILLAGDCEGGMLKLGSASASATPEQHIRKVRKLLANAESKDLRNGIAYKGHAVYITLKAKDPATNQDRFFDFVNPGEIREFLSAHADRLAEKVVVAWGMANISGPEMR